MENINKILITGGAGFIGSHLAELYIGLGKKVTVIDLLTTGSVKNINTDHVEFIKGDIRDKALIERLTEKTDLILHMAAALGVDNIMHSPIESMSTNILGSEVVLRAANKYEKRILIASTSEIYGKNPKQPLMEDDDRLIGSPQNIRWSYSDAKAIEEAMARSLFLSDGLRVSTVRFFNTVGPKQTGKYGMVIPRFVDAALKNKDIRVFGDGSQTRVFGHVLDAVAGVEAVLNYKGSIGEVFNIGGFGETSVLELAEAVISATHSKSKIVFIPYDEAYPEGYEDMQRRVPDTSKLTAATGWKATRGLSEIITDVVNYFKNN